MNLNVEEWKEFKFGNLIDKIYKARAYTKDDLDACGNNAKSSIRYITRTANNNGCEMRVVSSELLSIEEGKAITIGDTTATCFYQSEFFICGDHMVVVRAYWLNEYTGQFICALLTNEMYKYSYGRAFIMDRIKNTILNLPIKYNADGTTYIDEEYQYSVEGYVPDWDFMEDYIKSLHSKQITTKNKVKHVPDLNVQSWKEFKIPKLFNVCAGNYYSKDEYEKGNTPYISASNMVNGIGEKTNLKPDFTGNKITIGKLGATAYYQSEDFCATSDVNVLTPLFELNVYNGLFITQVINSSENYKWSYGRQCRVGDTKGIIIKLPIKNNVDGTPYIDEACKYSDKGYVPDWKFMEEYIKQLPYGDRIEIKENVPVDKMVGNH